VAAAERAAPGGAASPVALARAYLEPSAAAAGFDPVWFCILFLIVIQTSCLTPPMAPAIFYLRAVAPDSITIRHMYRGVVPFIALQLATLLVTMAWPSLVTWLPQQVLQLR
jgi:TRAP-type mannitol/chloroaromatic compound transport system permease large subunit